MTRLVWISAACALAACHGDRAAQPPPGRGAAPAPPVIAPFTFGPPERFGGAVLRQGHVASLAFVSPTELDALSWDGVLSGDPPEDAARNRLVRLDLSGSRTIAVAGSDAPITDAAFAPLAHVAAIATLDGTIAMRDDDDFAPRWKTALDVRISGVAIAPDGARVLVGDEHGQLYQLDGASGAIQWHDAGLRGYASVLAYSPSGRYVAIGGHDDDVLVLDGRSHALVARLHHRAPSEESDRPPGVLSLAFAPDERTIATGGWDDTIHVFALPSGARVREMRTPGDPFALAYSPDGAWLVYGGRDHDVAFWHARDGAPGPAFDASPRVDDEPWKAIAALAFSPDGQTLATGSWDGAIRTWSVAAIARGAAGAPAGRVRLIGLSRDGATMISIGEDHRVITWDVATGAERDELATSEVARVLAIAPDATTIARTDGLDLAIVDVPSGQTRVEIDHGAATADPPVAFSSDGARVLAIAGDHLQLHDARTGGLLTTFAGTRAWSLGFADGDRAVWWVDQDLHVVDAATGAPRATIAHVGERALHGALSPDGRALAVLIGAALTVWDVGTAKRRFTRDDAVGVEWTADGRALAIARYGGPIEIVDPVTGQVVATVPGAGPASAIATGAHGELAAASADGIELWRPVP